MSALDWLVAPPQAPCASSREAAREHQLHLTKPPGSLGRLESLSAEFAAWQRCHKPDLARVQICVFAADHGVAEEGVSAFPQSVTVQMINNFVSGGAAITVLAQELGAAFRVVNLGTAQSVPDMSGLVNLPLAPGSANITRQAALNDSLLTQALCAGRDQVDTSAHLFVGGEMGIGNTTSAAAMTCALLGLTPVEVVGRGTGVTDETLEIKRDVVQRALELHGPHCDQPLQVLQRLGGLEIAGLVGSYIHAAQSGVPSLVDGFICTAAALLACRVNPGVRDWLLFSHRSAERGHRLLLEALSAEPLLDLGMRLGEASGAAVTLPILRLACALHGNMATFEQAGVSDGAGGS